MAVGAGAMIGVFLILLDQTPDDSGVVPLLANRAVNAAVMWTIIGMLALRRTGAAGLRSRWTAIAAGGGLLDASANALILVGLRLGDLTTMSVLVALYPAGTIILAAVVLRERIAPVQWIGLVLAVAAAGMLSVS